jgi:DNA-binding CsgD family transcriptional regulator
MDARNDARNVARLLSGATAPNVDQRSVAESLGITIPALHQSFAAALAAIGSLTRQIGQSHVVDDVSELLERPRHVARVLSDAGLWRTDVTAAELATRLGELEGRMRRAESGITPKPKKMKPRRPRQPGDLTVRQVEILALVGECNGNLAAAARKLGVSRATVQQSYRRAMEITGAKDYRDRKLKSRGRALPHDARGQEIVPDDDESGAARR